MNRSLLLSLTNCVVLASAIAWTADARANFLVEISGSTGASSDFDLTDAGNFNQVTFFRFEITIAANLVPGGAYVDPAINSIDYRIDGSLVGGSTPSGFTNFQLERTLTGTEFYNLSADSALSFSVAPGADLSDGLQVSELAGAGVVFSLNAREFDQNPGRYHPPIFTLSSDGSGRLANADNQSKFLNPAPPMGSGELVDVAVGEEYDITLSFDPAGVTIAVPEPSPMLLLGAVGAITLIAVCSIRRRARTAA